LKRTTTIPQRVLRNRSGEVLRRAEAGERFTVTVGGRPVAELGPLERRSQAPTFDRLNAILDDTPVDASWAADLAALRGEDREAAVEPWD